MGISSDLLNAPKEFLALYKAGKEAAQQGDNRTAHELFRQAIAVDPYHEQIWLWLASVVETDEDRRVCFENVLKLNPGNPTARRQLNTLAREPLHVIPQAETRSPQKRSRRRRRLRLFLLALIGIAGAVGAVLYGPII
jgi:ferric-dicitrate binding protein FerR (iron transport regulator)